MDRDGYYLGAPQQQIGRRRKALTPRTALLLVVLYLLLADFYIATGHYPLGGLFVLCWILSPVQLGRVLRRKSEGRNGTIGSR